MAKTPQIPISPGQFEVIKTIAVVSKLSLKQTIRYVFKKGLQAVQRKKITGRAKNRGFKKVNLNSRWLKYALLKGGFTHADIAGEKSVSRQAIQRIAKELGIDLTERNQTIWQLNRYARRFGKPGLKRKAWVEYKLRTCGGPLEVDRNLGLPKGTTGKIARLHEIKRSLLKKEGEIVKVVCTHCGKSKWRKKFLILPNQKKFFCNPSHYRKHMKEHHPRSRYWTDEDLKFLRENYKRVSDRKLAFFFETSAITISRKRRKLRLIRPGEQLKRRAA